VTEIRRVRPDDPPVKALIDALDAFQIGLYGRAYCHLASIDELSAEHVEMLGAWDGEQLLGIGAVMHLPGYAEIKRMITTPEARGRGVGSAILAALEDLAAARNTTIVRLETGAEHHAAQAMYRKAGYAIRGPYGAYSANHVSVFMEKTLAL